MNDRPKKRLHELCQAAARLPGRERRDWLKQQCGGDVSLMREVMLLLEQDQSVDEHSKTGNEKVAKTVDTRDVESSRGKNSEPKTLNQVGQTVGPFKLLQRIGEGGMGTVYMAEQNRPVRRQVALKIIKPGLDTKQVIARFEAERQALAMMDHNHIARVLDAGATEDGHPYFAMELVKGIPITKYCDDNRLTVAERLKLFIPVCHAIQHAHQKGVIHRDIKPSNVLVSMHDGKPVPKVIDFGLAKATHQKLTEKTMFTALGQVVGTLEYMSPEQAEMNQLDIDTRSDVYSLGVLLYKLLTGTTPITSEQLRKAGLSEILKTIRQHEPPKPSTRLSESADSLPAVSTSRKTEPIRLSRLLRGDLDWIVMKTLEKDRTRRYETANGLAADIGRYLRGDPVEAGPPSTRYRLQKFATRYRSLLITGVATSAVLLIATCLSSWLAYRASVAQALAKEAEQVAVEAEELANVRLLALGEEQKKTANALITSRRETKRAEVNAKRAMKSEEEARRLLYRSNMREAVIANQKYDIGRVRELLLGHAPKKGETDFRDFAWHHLWSSTHSYDRLLPHGAPIVDMDLSPDGIHAATVSSDGICRIWDVESGLPVGRLDFGNQIGNTIRFSPDGNWISAAGYSTRSTTIWDWRTGESKFTLQKQPAYVTRLCWTPDFESIASGRHTGRSIWFHDAKTGALQKQIKIDTGGGSNRNLVISPNGRRLAATNSHSRGLSILDLETNEEIAVERPEGGWNDELDGDLEFSPDSTRLLSCGKGGITLWEASSGKQIVHRADNTVPWQTIAFRPDGKTVFAAGERKLVECDARTLQVLRRYPAHAGRIVEMAVTPDGGRLLTAGTDGVVQVRDVSSRSVTDFLRRRTKFAQFLDNGELLSVGWNNDFSILDSSAQNVRSVTKLDHSVATAGNDGQLLATGRSDGTVELWNLQTGKLIRSFELAASKPRWSDSISALALLPDSDLLAVATAGYQSFLIDTKTYRLKQKLPSSRAHAIGLSPNGETLAVPFGVSSQSDSHFEIYSLEDGTLLQRAHHSSGSIRSIAYSDDSSLLASAGTEMVIRVTRTGATGDQGIVLRGHAATVQSIAFSPDGRLLASGDAEGVVRVWSLAERIAIDIIQTDSSSIRSLDFSPDGTKLVAAGDAGIELLSTVSDKEILRQVKLDQFLVKDDWAGLFGYLAEVDRRPEWSLNMADAVLKEAIVAISSDQTRLADSLVQSGIEIVRAAKMQAQSSMMKRLKKELLYELLMTNAGIACLESEIPRFRELCRQANAVDSYRPLRTTNNSAALRALGEQRRQQILGSQANVRRRKWLELLLDGYKYIFISIRRADGSVAEIWSARNLPSDDFKLVAFGRLPIPTGWLTSSDFNHLSGEPELQSITFRVHLTQPGFWEGLADLSQLKSLSLARWSGQNKKEVAAIGCLDRLTRLTVDSHFTGFRNLDRLTRLKQLEAFSLLHGWITKADAAAICQLPYLKQLNLSWSILGDDAMVAIAKMEQLEELFLDATSVTADGLKLLEGHPSLKRLDLFEVPVGDDVVNVLAKIPKLAVAGLLDTEVSLEGVLKLQQALPDCVVFHHQGPRVVTQNDRHSINAPLNSRYFPPLSTDATTLAAMIAKENAANNPPRISEQTCVLMEGPDAGFDCGVFQLNPEQGVTMEAWVQPTGYSLAASFGDEIFHARTGPDFESWFNVRLSARRGWVMISEPHDLGQNTFMGGGSVADGRLMHLAAVVAPQEMSLFVNGESVATNPIEAGLLGDTWDFKIGRAFSRRFQGLVDEVRISNTVRYTEDFEPQREFVSDRQTIALYHFDAHPRGILFDSSPALRHIAVKPKFVKLPGDTNAQPSGTQSEPDSALNELLGSLDQMDPAEVPRLRPYLKYRNAPDRDRTSRTAIDVDETSKGLEIPAFAVNMRDGLTMEAWVKPEGRVNSRWGPNFLRAYSGEDPATSLSLMVREHQAYAAVVGQFNRDGKLIKGSYRSALDPGQAFFEIADDLPWSHVAVTIEGDLATLFLNGKPVATADVSNQRFGDDWKFVIGQNFKGKIDDVRVSETVRYREKFTPSVEWESDEATAMLYHFDRNEEAIVWDHSGNNRHVQNLPKGIRWVDVPSRK